MFSPRSPCCSFPAFCSFVTSDSRSQFDWITDVAFGPFDRSPIKLTLYVTSAKLTSIEYKDILDENR
jgi:hypothetical protein